MHMLRLKKSDAANIWTLSLLLHLHSTDVRVCQLQQNTFVSATGTILQVPLPVPVPSTTRLTVIQRKCQSLQCTMTLLKRLKFYQRRPVFYFFQEAKDELRPSSSFPASLPFPPFFPSPLVSFEVGPLNPGGESGERRKLP